MAYNFRRAEREQPFLLPPDLRDWLPESHLAWFVLDVVDQLDLQPFYRAHRDDGHGHPAYDPKTAAAIARHRTAAYPPTPQPTIAGLSISTPAPQPAPRPPPALP